MNKLNLGAGEDRKDGYINIDWNPLAQPDAVHDLNSFPYPFVDNFFDLAEASHVLEHLDKPFLVMKELNRIIKPGGKLIIKVPHFSRGFTHAEHSHGFDVTFPLYFNPTFTKSGFFGVEFKLESLKLRWLAFFHLLPNMGYGRVSIAGLKAVNAVISGLANLSPNICSRLWCYWVGGFDEVEFIFSKPNTDIMNNNDQCTADAFASSWNNLPTGSVYTNDQFDEWMNPLSRKDVADKRILELGCGNGSLMEHMLKWGPQELIGVDLGDSVLSARKNLKRLGYGNWKIDQADLTKYDVGNFDLVYCIGVLHHLQTPKNGLDAVIKNTKPGGIFHCWVYAKEGNWVIINIVDPLRKLTSKLPWWITKYLIATPLSFAYMIYAKIIAKLPVGGLVDGLPLASYSRWIAKRNFSFFRHVAFDQLVTPQTAYIPRVTIENWLSSYPQIDPDSRYIIFRNGNSWKFGGKIKPAAETI